MGASKDRWAITSEKTALLVIDMQRAFVDRGAPRECPGAQEIVPRINKLAAACRRCGIPVVFIKSNRRADLSDAGLTTDIHPWHGNDQMLPLEGRAGGEFCLGLKVTSEDYVVPKIRYSAFIPGSSSLEPLLRGLGRDSLMVCGVATDVCVESTVRDAMMLEYRTFVIGDVTAAASEECRKSSLSVLGRHFARIISFKETMEVLAQLKTVNA